MNKRQSRILFARAKQLLPGGVNSPVRAFRSVNTTPVFIESAQGAYLYDVDGNRYLDYSGGFGTLILGHAYPEVVKAVGEQVQRGTIYGACCPQELQLVETLTRAVPSMESVRLVNSGTEATMSVIRLARAATGKNKILKFSGCYHGHGDGFLIKAGSGMLAAGLSNSSGITASTEANTLVAPYNDYAHAEKLFVAEGDSIAAVIVEPIAGNMGLIPALPGFLEGLRELTAKHGALLIFDEVITGFRLTYGGYQTQIDIRPDLTILGKIIGGGLPIGAYGGRKELMDMIAPSGSVYQAGTFSGNPLTAIAGQVTLQTLKNGQLYAELEKKGDFFEKHLRQALKDKKFTHTLVRKGSMFTLFFAEHAPHNYEKAQTIDASIYAEIFRQLLAKGIYFPPTQFETAFISAAHTRQELEYTASVFADLQI